MINSVVNKLILLNIKNIINNNKIIENGILNEYYYKPLFPTMRMMVSGGTDFFTVFNNVVALKNVSWSVIFSFLSK